MIRVTPNLPGKIALATTLACDDRRGNFLKLRFSEIVQNSTTDRCVVERRCVVTEDKVGAVQFQVLLAANTNGWRSAC